MSCNFLVNISLFMKINTHLLYDDALFQKKNEFLNLNDPTVDAGSFL